MIDSANRAGGIASSCSPLNAIPAPTSKSSNGLCDNGPNNMDLLDDEPEPAPDPTGNPTTPDPDPESSESSSNDKPYPFCDGGLIIPHRFAIAIAVSFASPVTITTETPPSCNCFTDAATFLRGGSSIPTNPANVRLSRFVPYAMAKTLNPLDAILRDWDNTLLRPLSVKSLVVDVVDVEDVIGATCVLQSPRIDSGIPLTK
mmetsp:Transcript_33760/g.39335  ORF Transcript_33760/g.39335 Transcript_33760/m.39335 type:complete len:202 (+) Transcript_33760:1048-1653(+)